MCPATYSASDGMHSEQRMVICNNIIFKCKHIQCCTDSYLTDRINAIQKMRLSNKRSVLVQMKY